MKGEAQVAHVLDTNHFLPPSRHSQLTSFMNLRIMDRAEEAQVSEVLRLSPSLQKRSETRNLVQLRLCPPDSDCRGIFAAVKDFKVSGQRFGAVLRSILCRERVELTLKVKDTFLKPMF